MSASSKKSVRSKRRRRKNTVSISAPSAITIHDALRLQQSGDYEKAKQVYCQILAEDPTHVDAWHHLGIMLHSTGHDADAIECLENALSIDAGNADIGANLGLVYRSAGQVDNALAALQRTVDAHPQHVAARNGLGTVLMETGRLQEAEMQFQMALKINPASLDAMMNLANLWQRHGRLHDAELLYRRCLDRDPDNALLLTNLGESLRRQCQWTEAANVFRAAIKANPRQSEAQLNLGRTLQNLGQHDEAVHHFRKMTRVQPDNAKAHHYLGRSLSSAGDHDGAQQSLNRALELQPDDPFAHSSLGFVYLDSGDHPRAASCFGRSLQLDPTMSESHSCLLYIQSGDATVSQEQLFADHLQWGQVHGRMQPLGSCCNDRDRNRRLRIGYVSPDFRQHAVAAFFRPVLQAHCKDAVETFCYAEVASPDETTTRLQSLADNWHGTTGFSDQQVSQRIINDKIDILVDLAGHTSRNRLGVFGYKPAPLQMTWLGYPNTTGLAAIDYRLTCEIQNPTEEESYHCEELIRMPGGSFCFSAPNNAPDVNASPAVKNGFVTFGSLHRPFKISAATRALWAKVLLSLPTSRLLVLNTRFTDETKATLQESLVKAGVDPSRIEIRSTYDGASYLDTYHEIDIALDVGPWSGGTTTLEALWMGVPVAAKYGDRRSARSTAAIVAGVGHSEWIARDDDAYVQVTTRLANDLPLMCRHREQLRQETRETIVNADRFTRRLEIVYRDAWHRWCDS